MSGKCPLCRVNLGVVSVVGPKSREREVEEAARLLYRLCRSEGGSLTYDAAKRYARKGVIEELASRGVIALRSDEFSKMGGLLGLLMGAPLIAGGFVATGLLFGATIFGMAKMLEESYVVLVDKKVCRGKPISVFIGGEGR